MKNLLYTFLLVCLSIFQNQIFAQGCTELLQNPGFENELAGWNISGDVHATFSSASGDLAARFCDPQTGLNQVLPTSPGKVYDVSFWYETEANHELTVYQIRSLDANWNPLEMQGFNGIIYATSGGITGTTNFEYKQSSSTITAPPGAAWFQVSVWHESGGCIKIDDFSVCESGTSTTGPELTIIGTPCPMQFPIENTMTTLPFTVKNVGDEASESQKFYLYRANVCRFCSPVNLGEVDVPAIQPGEEVDLTIYGVMRGMISGNYNVLGRLDQVIWGDLFLSDEISQFPNNLKTIDYYCRKFNGDLSVEIEPLTTEYDNSGEISFKIKVENTGPENAVNVAVHFLDPVAVYNNTLDVVVQSPDAVLQSTSEGVQWHIPGLGANSMKEITVTYQLLGPGQFTTLPNSFTLNAKISSGHNLNTDTSNDSASVVFTKSGISPGGADLNLKAVGSPVDVDPWQFTSANFELTNEGTEPASGIEVYFEYPGPEMTLKGGDPYSASQGTMSYPNTIWKAGSLNPGETATFSLNFFSLSSDEFKVFAGVQHAQGNDPDSSPGNSTPPVPQEDDEALFIFNPGTSPLQFPDFTIDNLQSAGSVLRGTKLPYSFDLKNIGTANPDRDFEIGIYLSNDNILASDDRRLGSINGGAQPPAGETKSFAGMISIPSDVTPGDYIVFFKADENDIITELKEDNNEAYNFVNITGLQQDEPDLTISNLFLDQVKVAEGEVLTYRFDVANIGAADIPGDFNIRAYLSADGDISPDDIQDGIVPTGNFDSGLSVTGVPGASTVNLPEGIYYLILKVDADEIITETDETNNTVQSSIQFIVENDPSDPSVCDKNVGMGTLSCFEAIGGTDNFKIAYDSSGWQVEKTLDSNLEIITSSNPTQIPGFPRYTLDSTSFKKLNGYSNDPPIYEKTIPQVLADKIQGSFSALEFGGGYVFLAWRAISGNPSYSADELYGIRTDADFNILNEELLTTGSGDPSGNFAYSGLEVNSNGIAFYLRTGFSSSGTLTLYLIDGDLNILDTDLVYSGAFGIGGSVRENFCGRFTVSDFIGFSYCKSGGCYASHKSEVDFENNQINVLNSFGVEHRTQLGRGFEKYDWFTRTSDGGALTGSRNQTLNWPQVVPEDAVITFRKTNPQGVFQWEEDYLITNWADVVKIYEEGGEYFVVKNSGGVLNISNLGCYDLPLELADLSATDVSVPASVSVGGTLSVSYRINNTGTGAAGESEVGVYFSRDEVLSFDDVLVENRFENIPSLDVGGFESITLDAPIYYNDPIDLYLLIISDVNEEVAESDESNNLTAIPFSVVEQPVGADLSLSFPAFLVSPAQWSFFSVPLTVTNTGQETATGIEIQFKRDQGVVYEGNNEFNSSQGDFTYYGDEVWSVGTLEPGESAVLTVNYFRLSGNELNIYAQVSEMDQTDSDSTPDNGNCCISNEDDEAILVLGNPFGNTVGSRNAIINKLNLNESFAILNAAPNPVFNELNLEVFSDVDRYSDLVMYDILGKSVLHKSVELKEGHNSIQVETSDLPPGILTVTLSPNHPHLRQLRVLKMKD